MNAESLRKELEKREAELSKLESDIENLNESLSIIYRNCTHSWEKVKHIPYSTPFSKTIIHEWGRTCENCGCSETTTHVKAGRPDFERGKR